MIKSKLESGESRGQGAFDEPAQPVDDLPRVLAHIILDPVEHEPDKHIAVGLGDKLLVLIPNRHAVRFLLYDAD
jgi:hypothetical protein